MMMLMSSLLLSVLIPPILIILTSMMHMNTTNDREKLSPFECGFDPTNKARLPFSMRFFLLAITFIIFDIEIILLMPIPIILTYKPTLTSMTIIFIFLMVLLMGILYEWYSNALDWPI